MKETVKQKVLSIIIDTENCIEYNILNKDGYGHIQYRENGIKKHILAHRLSYSLHNNIELNPNLIIMHKCDNPACINPKHLLIGTHLDNVKDKVSKNRQAKGTDNGRYSKGHYSKYKPIAKPKKDFISLYNRGISEEKVLAVKKAIREKTTTLKKIAEDIGISYSTVKDIKSERVYKNVA